MPLIRAIPYLGKSEPDGPTFTQRIPSSLPLSALHVQVQCAETHRRRRSSVGDMDHNDQQTLAYLANSQIAPSEASPSESGGGGGGKRKAGDDGTPQQRAKRNRYISIACNECKRRKIKCNGQSPCQRCGNLNLDCVYAPNCCNGFKDSREYQEMAGHIASLQEQVNMLYQDLSSLRQQLGHAPPPPLQQQGQQQQIHVPPPPAPIRQATPQQAQQQGQPPSASIDPSLQSYFPRGTYPDAQALPGSMRGGSASPNSIRRRSQSQNQQPSFRGPTSAEFNFDVAKSSLQTMGITGGHNGAEAGGSGEAGTATENPTPLGSPLRRPGQLMQSWSTDKDPIWSISKEEAIRLCQIYEDEMGLMYPVLDINKVMTYAAKLYQFMEAAHRTGLMQQGMPGPDAIEDEDTNILKMVLAIAMTVEASGRSDMGRRLFEYVQPAIDTLLLGSVGVKGIRLLALTVRSASEPLTQEA